MFVCEISINEDGVTVRNVYEQFTRPAPILPYIPWEGCMLTGECTKYCNQELGSLRWTVTVVKVCMGRFSDRIYMI